MRSLRNRSPIPIVILAMFGALMTLSMCQKPRQDLTRDDVAQIQELFVDDAAGSYRFSLPVVENGEIVGSEVVGALPLSTVERIAASQGITLAAESHIHGVLVPPGGLEGAGGAGGSGGDQSSMTTTPTNKIERLRQVLRGLDASRYQLLIEESLEGP